MVANENESNSTFGSRRVLKERGDDRVIGGLDGVDDPLGTGLSSRGRGRGVSEGRK